MRDKVEMFGNRNKIAFLKKLKAYDIQVAAIQFRIIISQPLKKLKD
jgi:hypothetical protein